jgi:EAL domain-containing protein (putative c-di-GMP-specific phosphodiesterase class I)
LTRSVNGCWKPPASDWRPGPIEPALANLTIAVNVSARQFHDDAFVDQVLAALARSGAKPQRLKLELTESLLVNDVDEIIAKMTASRRKGFTFRWTTLAPVTRRSLT